MLDDDFLRGARRAVENFEKALKWSPAKNEDARFVVCPIDESHRVPEKSLKKHERTCTWRSHGYSKCEARQIVLAENNPKAASSIDSDALVAAIAPGIPPIRNHERFVSDLSREQRLQVYDRMVECTKVGKRPDDPALFVDLSDRGTAKDEKITESLGELERVQAERDTKRRRQTFRAKNVHITKRSQTEIIREVLRVHMEELQQAWNEENKRGLTESNKQPPELSPRSRDVSVSRHSRGRSHDHNPDRVPHENERKSRDNRDENRSHKHKGHRDESFRDGRYRRDSSNRSRGAQRSRSRENHGRSSQTRHHVSYDRSCERKRLKRSEKVDSRDAKLKEAPKRSHDGDSDKIEGSPSRKKEYHDHDKDDERRSRKKYKHKKEQKKHKKKKHRTSD